MDLRSQLRSQTLLDEWSVARGRQQTLLDEWAEAFGRGWQNTTDGLPPSQAYIHWLEEQLVQSRKGST